jgi:hypothetical protein
LVNDGSGATRLTAELAISVPGCEPFGKFPTAFCRALPIHDRPTSAKVYSSQSM